MFSGVWFNNSIHPYSGFRFRLPGFLHQIFIRSCKPLPLSLFFHLFLLPSAFFSPFSSFHVFQVFLNFHSLFFTEPCLAILFYLSIQLPVFLSFIYLFIYSVIYLYIFKCIYLSIHSSIYLLHFILPIYLYLYPFIYLSIFSLIFNQLQCTVRCPTELTVHQ